AFERGRMAQRECSVVVRREDDDEELYFSPSKKMVGERSPDSVLFRLEDLEAAAEASGPPPLRLSNTAPGGGSGLIDLRELVPESAVSEVAAELDAPLGSAASLTAQSASRSGSSGPSSSPHLLVPAAWSSPSLASSRPAPAGNSAWATVLLVVGAVVALGAGVLVLTHL